MIKRSIQKMESTKIENEEVKGVSMKLLIGRDDKAPNFAMRHFTVECDGFTPKHKHPWEHEVLVLSGNGEVECNGEMSEIVGGDSLLILSNELHQFRNNGNEPLEFLCIVPVDSDCGKQVPGS